MLQTSDVRRGLIELLLDLWVLEDIEESYQLYRSESEVQDR